jgi:hypothetical protein
MLSEVSQAQKDKDCLFSLICGSYIYKINKCTHIHIYDLIYIYRYTYINIYIWRGKECKNIKTLHL